MTRRDELNRQKEQERERLLAIINSREWRENVPVYRPRFGSVALEALGGAPADPILTPNAVERAFRWLSKLPARFGIGKAA